MLENNLGSQQPDTVALSKSCIVFSSIILAREELLINVLEHTGATDDRLEGEKLKAIRKQLFLNHPLTLSSHCVAYLSIFPYTLPSLIFPLFVPSIPARVSKCALYETLRTSALWLIKLPPEKLTATAHILCNRFILPCLSVLSSWVAQPSGRVDGVLHSGQNSEIFFKEIFLGCSWARWEGCH